ncbi:histidine kinase dimerization/phospho-acceptor domain-containing protein [Aurantiacibacter suaedae]|uniref:histidine kinase dimerization/phospho-acceptor domain-containing protein n=1 Tax=Aurantiacibacter suaedae TaxID=2545755 RepID=UPI0010F55586|nr:histidine kinase dimerization/phospho-acceptor domain-containing protein [Aurantiacibacter suaedae]
MFDDRLATVLRMAALGQAGQLTQFRQLLDLLGTLRDDQAASPVVERGFARLTELRQHIAPEEQARILRESGLRLRNPRLVAVLAEGEPRIAAAAMATARLTEAQWRTLIPQLPVGCRGFLRHRRDLPASATTLLARLGIGDLVLSDAARETRAEAISQDPPAPAPLPKEDAKCEQKPETPAVPLPPAAPAALEPLITAEPEAPDEPKAPVEPTASAAEPRAIGEIIERIEIYRSARRTPVLAPRLPLGDAPASEQSTSVMAFDAVTDAEGRVLAASDPVISEVLGMLLTGAHPGPLVSFGEDIAPAFRLHQPVRAGRIALKGRGRLAGDWLIEASPIFERPRGNFAGYRCRLRRPPRPSAAERQVPENAGADRMRQILHELRTPVGAIQGFAEVIQQQMFGPAPHEYRAHAAAITVDAARLLAGFDELDRLARLQTGAAKLESGESDLAEVFSETLRRLRPVLEPRDAAIELETIGGPFPLAIARTETRLLSWRLLATMAGALAPSETLTLKLEQRGKSAYLSCHLPQSLHDLDAFDEKRRGALSSGVFGPRFALDLAAAEAHAAGGKLTFAEKRVSLHLPLTGGGLLTPASQAHSTA